MRFYNRVNELNELYRIQFLLFNEYSRMPIVTGRRRIGKTSLIISRLKKFWYPKHRLLQKKNYRLQK